MATVPTRDSTDPNASADINTLQSQIVDTVSQADAEAGVSTNIKAWTAQRVAQAIAALASGGSTEPDLFWSAGSVDYPVSNPAPLDIRTLTNGTVKEQLHDDSTNESVIGQYRVPSDIDTSGTVTFTWGGSPVTAAADEVVYVFRHSAAGDGEDIDVAYTTEASAAETMSATQDALNIITWTETVANLGWAANDIVRWIVERDAAGTYQAGDNLSGDCGSWFFSAIIPRT